MKRILVIFCLIVAVSLIGHAQMRPDKLPPLLGPPEAIARLSWQMGGGVAAPGGCTSGTTDTSYTGEEGDWGTDPLNTGDVYGQSFQVSKAGSIYSIEVEIYNVSSGETAELRVGTSTTLGDTYKSTVTMSHSSSTLAWVEYVLETPMEVSASTTYYFGLKGADNAGDSRLVKRKNLGGGEGYSGGVYMYGGTWTLGYSESTSESRFRVKLCD